MDTIDRSHASWILLSSNAELITSDTQSGFLVTADAFRWSGLEVAQELCLGTLDDKPVCLAEIRAPETLQDPWVRTTMRQALMTASTEQMAILGHARQLLAWAQDHSWCGRCGSKTQYVPGRERVLNCQACGMQWYPRITPCVIMLVLKEDRLLLGHSAQFPQGFFSCLAGFVEIGENLEQAVAREVLEESQIMIKNLRYFGSQTWPFPSQLMLGFYADYHSGVLKPDGEEVLEADWFQYQALPLVPSSKFSIAGQLIGHAVQKLSQGNRP
ncbi:MAG: NAD(+) diphosphatase [Gammaproteobacteria bacterium]